MSGSELVCQELVELVTGYLDNALTPARRTAVEAHLRDCGNCAAYVDQMRTMIALQADSAATNTPQESDLPAGMLDGLLVAFRGRRRSTRS